MIASPAYFLKVTNFKNQSLDNWLSSFRAMQDCFAEAVLLALAC
jgi:hypothetical protein